jgi:hypothetical protein
MTSGGTLKSDENQMHELAGPEEPPIRPRALGANQTQRRGEKLSATQMLKDDGKLAPPTAHRTELQKHDWKPVQSVRVQHYQRSQSGTGQGYQCP